MSYNSKYTGSQVESLLDAVPGKQDALVSGESIRTVNGQSLLGSGDIAVGGTDIYETVLVTLASNQTQPDASLVGAAVHVKYSDVDEAQEWQGEALSFKVPTSLPYTVEYPEVAGYLKPDDPASRTAVAGRLRELTATYNREAVLVSLASNQPSDESSLLGAEVTVRSGETVLHTFTWEGQALAFGLAFGTEYSVEASAIEGYRTPSVRTFTAGQASREVSFEYLAEVVTVTLASDDGTDVTGQTVTVNGVSHEYAAPVSAKVPFGTEYSVSVSDRDSYTTPAAQTFTAGQASRAVTMTYAYCPIKYSYITLNQGITDPAGMIGGDVNGEVIQWIRANSHRVLGKYTAAGTMTYCRLKDDDGTKYHDGTTADLTGGAGDVFMKLPQFWYKAEETSADVWRIGFADGRPDDTWTEWSGSDLIGVYEAYNTGSKVYSRSGVASTGSVSQANFKSYARARGEGFSIVKWRHHCIMAFLFYAQYGNMNCQAQCGAGTSSYTKSTGQTNSLGMTDTTAANGNSMSINFWGLENWWGNKYEWVDNVAVKDYVWSVTEDDGTVRKAGTAVSSSGWITKTLVGAHLDLLPTAVGGSDTTGYCDYYSASSGSRVVARSNSNSSTSGGVAFAGAVYVSSGTDTDIGARLAFSGSLAEAESVEAYKALKAIG